MYAIIWGTSIRCWMTNKFLLYEALIKLPKSNVLKYILEDDSWFVVRPSGTEPKMKIYLSVVGKSLKDSEEKLNSFKNSVMNRINNILA